MNSSNSLNLTVQIANAIQDGAARALDRVLDCQAVPA